ncbi:uncharacterized protein CIMG_00844 [Coccidioides immitis RS]|uniref:Uncharacterized protein n=2 Tax=Coccidioides immitis TaxID=5501 RepID=J3KHV9_COCIM|nr:uncharacterized protein CIMG_00844 [Coccidioides immitis RS]EAS35490.3 hypothetical protein CIMG_00844 [Coccidioides immitis RS]KMU85402.1 hypothetical protein CIHG_03184 [Coccidioides immitis H538.4]TPX26252.1 hypothetical protein DIZ76_011714 [Coccidioides immitis]
MPFLTDGPSSGTISTSPVRPHAKPLKRIGRTPPEFWSNRDWVESRRQRFLREQALQRASKQGLSEASVRIEFPEGRYWPYTPKFDQGFVDHVLDNRWRRYVDQSACEQLQAAGYEVGIDEYGRIVYWLPPPHVVFWE